MSKITLELTEEEAVVVRYALDLRRTQLTGALTDGEFVTHTTIGDEDKARASIGIQQRLIEELNLAIA